MTEVKFSSTRDDASFGCKIKQFVNGLISVQYMLKYSISIITNLAAGRGMENHLMIFVLSEDLDPRTVERLGIATYKRRHGLSGRFTKFLIILSYFSYLFLF